MANEPPKPPASDEERDSSGKFTKGNKVGAAGRARVPDEVREMWRDATPKATRRLIEMLDAERPMSVGEGGGAAHLEYVPDWDVRHKAIVTLYERQWGKAPQPVTGDEGTAPIGLIFLPSIKSDDE